MSTHFTLTEKAKSKLFQEVPIKFFLSQFLTCQVEAPCILDFAPDNSCPCLLYWYLESKQTYHAT